MGQQNVHVNPNNNGNGVENIEDEILAWDRIEVTQLLFFFNRIKINSKYEAYKKKTRVVDENKQKKSEMKKNCQSPIIEIYIAINYKLKRTDNLRLDFSRIPPQ